MKKWIAILLAGMMLFGFAACKSEPKEPEQTEPETAAVGGWTRPESMAVTDEVQELVVKATESLLGVDYAPVALIGTQLVSGTNYRVVCKATAVAPDAKAFYAILEIYQKLDGSVECTKILTSEAEAHATDAALAGGWSAPEGFAVSDEARAALEKAAEKKLGASYTPVALLGQQVVSGMNYAILCEIAPVTPNAESSFAVVTVYADLTGGAEITEIADFAA